MKAYLSSLLRITEYTIKNDNSLKYYCRWVHRKPKRILTEEEFETRHTSQNMAQEIEPNVIELDRLEVENEIKIHKKFKPKEVYRYKAPENFRRNTQNMEQDFDPNTLEFEQLDVGRNKKYRTNDTNAIELEHVDVGRKQKFRTKKFQSSDENKYKGPKTQKYAFDIDELDNKTHFENKKSKYKAKNQDLEVKEVKYANNEILAITFDEEGNYVYNKMKDNDSRIGSLMLMVKSRKLRERKENVLLEGKRLIRDALEVGCKMDHLLFSRKSDLDFIKDLLPERGVKLYKMAYKDMQMWSDLTTCPGIMGIFKTPNIENTKIQENALPITIICDNIREPGNLGSILRASVAVGCKNIILTKGCVDLWEPKVLRSATGAHFRLNIQKDVPWNQISTLIANDTSIFLADNKIITTNDRNKNSNQYLENLCTNVPLLPYFGVNFNEFESVTLIIGGETLGLSEEAYKLALEQNGVRLNIPLDNNVESLNTGTALGVIVFEIKRQFLTSKKD